MIYYSVRYNFSSSKDETLVVCPGDVGSSLLRSVEIHCVITNSFTLTIPRFRKLDSTFILKF